MNGPPGPEDVAAAYRWILGRDPESDAAVANHLAASETREALRRRLLRSAEFRTHHAGPQPPGPPPDAPPMPPAAEADAAEVEALLAALRRHWARLGETAPYWSCRAEDRFRPNDFGANRRAFFATGREDRDLLEGALARCGIGPDRLLHLVEFGCGVGRATLHLAALCPEVTALDFSAPHLDLARGAARERGLDHIRFLRSRPDQPMPVAGCDLWFSRHALQFNPPPVIRALLRLAFATLAPGGVAAFQLLTYGFGYTWEPEAGPEPSDRRPPQHALPQAEVFRLAGAAGLEMLDVQEEVHQGLDRRRWLSHFFVAQRRP